MSRETTPRWLTSRTLRLSQQPAPDPLFGLSRSGLPDESFHSNRRRSETEQPVCRCVPTIDLSEPRGAIAVSGRARGDKDLSVSSGLLRGPPVVRILTLDLCAPGRRFLTPPWERPVYGPGTAMSSSSSVSSDRTLLLSSTVSAPHWRSFVPMSAAPSPAVYPDLQDSSDTAHRGDSHHLRWPRI